MKKFWRTDKFECRCGSTITAKVHGVIRKDGTLRKLVREAWSSTSMENRKDRQKQAERCWKCGRNLEGSYARGDAKCIGCAKHPYNCDCPEAAQRHGTGLTPAFT